MLTKELSHYKILLVDDKEENLISLSSVLKSEGFKADCALSGKEALKMLLKNDYGLIILDVQMPEMNGFEVAEFIKGNNKTKDIPLIFLSANAIDKDYFKKGHAVGALDYLAKPTDVELLLLKVKNFLQLHHSNTQLNKLNQELKNKASQATLSYENLYHSLPQDIYLINRNGIVVNINRESKLCCGLSASEILNKHYSKSGYLNSILGEMDKTSELDQFFLNKTKPKNVDFNFKNPDLSITYGEASITTAVLNEEIHLQVSVNDVTQKKEAEIIQRLNVKEISNSEKLTTAILHGADINEVSDILLNTLYDLANIKSSRIYIYDSASNLLTLAGEMLDKGLINHIEKRIGIKLSSIAPPLIEGSLFNKIVHNKQGIITADNEEVKKILTDHSSNIILKKLASWTKKIMNIETFGVLPLVANEKILGLITFSSPLVLKEDEKQTIIRFSKQAATVLSKKKNEIDLAQSEAFNKGILSSLSSHIAVVDKKGKIISVNESWKQNAKSKTPGKLIQALEGSNYFKIFEKEILKNDHFSNTAMAALEGLKSVLNKDKDRFELEYSYQSGQQVYWYILNVSSFNNDNQKVVVRHVNITNRKKTEEEINENRALLKNIYEASSDSVIIINEKGSITNWNTKSEALFGWSEKEVFGMQLSDTVMPKRYVETYEMVMEQYFKTKNNPLLNQTVETTCMNKLGEEFYISLNIAVSMIKGKRHFIGFVRDISERKKAEKLLFDSQQRYKNLLKNMNDGFMVNDVNGEITFANEQLRKIFGIQNRNLNNFNSTDYIASKYQKLILERQKKRRAGISISDNFEFIGLHKNGSKIWLEVRVNQIMENGIFKGTQSVIRDITKRKETEKSLIESEKTIRNFANHLNQVLEDERTNLAREIHDELGQQLAGLKFGISSFRKFAQNEPQLDSKIKDLLNDVDITIQGLRKIATELRPGILDTLGLAASITWLVKEFEKKNKTPCRLETNIGEQIFDKKISTCFFRICQESLTNISKHANASEINIALNFIDGKLLLSIKDNGKGIMSNKQNNPFSMGLIGMKERANIIGGKLIISSEEGKGTEIQTEVTI